MDGDNPTWRPGLVRIPTPMEAEVWESDDIHYWHDVPPVAFKPKPQKVQDMPIGKLWRSYETALRAQETAGIVHFGASVHVLSSDGEGPVSMNDEVYALYTELERRGGARIPWTLAELESNKGAFK